MILNEDADTGMICVVILDDDNPMGSGGLGLASAITVNFQFSQNGETPLASKLLSTLYPWHRKFYSAYDDI